MTTAPTDRRPLASISLDADNLWSYLRTHGDPAWQDRPSYLPVLAERMRELFAAHRLTPTVFVVGADAAGPDGPDFVSSLVEFGCEIGNHSYEHQPWLHLYSPVELREELRRTEEALQAAGAPKPRGFRAPGYSMSPDLMRALLELDYDYDCSVLATWIGPLARQYYLRSNPGLSAQERTQRKALFGSVWDATLPNKGFTWTSTDGAGGPRRMALTELPVTVFPGARVPMHASYVIYLDALSPRLARAFVASAVRACVLSGTTPSLLLHPLDLLDRHDAPGLEFFPGMGAELSRKREVLDHLLTLLARHYRLVSTAEHAREVAGSTKHRAAEVLDRGRAG